MGIMEFNQSSDSNNIDHHDLHLQFHNSNHDHLLLLHDHSQKPHLSSQLSLPSLPSLTSQSHHNHNQYYPSNTTTIHHHCLTTFKCQTTTTSYISSLAVAGKSIITATSDGEIRSWNRGDDDDDDDEEKNHNSINDYNILMAAGKGAVKSLVVSGHDKLLFSAHQDHKIRVWKIENHDHHTDHKKLTRLATLPTLGDRASKLLIPNNHVQIRRNKKCTWVHHVDTVSALALSIDEHLLYSVSWDRTLKIWRTADFKCLESVTNAHDDAINAVAASVDGYIYTGSADKKIKIWKRNMEEEKKHLLIASLEKHNSGINALALSSDGSVLYSGACDRSIVVWEKDSGGIMEVVGALRGHSKSILCLAVVEDVIFSGSADKTIRIWRGKDRNYSCLGALEGHSGPVKCLTAGIDSCNSSEDGNSYLLYSGGLDRDIKVWQIIVPN